jgi:hypothetical protein
MKTRYYFDTCIWIDYYDNRVGPRGRPLGAIAGKLLLKIIMENELVAVSDGLTVELNNYYGPAQTLTMLKFISRLCILKKVIASTAEILEAEVICR